MATLVLSPRSPAAAQEKPTAVAPATKPALSAEERARKLKELNQRVKQANKYASEKKLTEAIVEVEKLLSIAREVLGQEDDNVISSLDWLARLHGVKDDFKAAIQARQEILAIRQRRPNEPAWKITDARLALERCRRVAAWDGKRRVRYREALRLIERSEQLHQQAEYRAALELAIQYEREIGDLLGGEHPQYAASLDHLGTLYSKISEYPKAEPLYQQAMAIRKRTLGEEHPEYAANLNNLGWLYKEMGEYRKAEPLYLRAIEIRKRTLGENHLEYAGSLNNLAILYNSMGDYRKAEPLLTQAVAIRKRTLGVNHPSYADSLNNLAILYASICEYREAEPLYVQSIEIRKRTLGENHPVYADSLNNLGGLYHRMGECRKAEPLYRQAIEIQKRSLGERHPTYANSVYNLAKLCAAMGEYRKAEQLNQQSMEVFKRILGEQNRATPPAWSSSPICTRRWATSGGPSRSTCRA